MNFTVMGAGYVGISIAILISQKYNVNLYDIDTEKLNLISNKKSPIKDNDVENYLRTKELLLNVIKDKQLAIHKADYVIIATPTNYDSKEGIFDTSSVESVIAEIYEENPRTNIIIKSTVPLGFTKKMRLRFGKENIYFSPEFLREGTALYDNLFPSRIIVGGDDKQSKKFANILFECSKTELKNTQILLMESSEAEAVKLFSNTYLAMRVAFFNELDTLSEINNLSSLNIINGVCSDSRIGNFYNNPSFGYGGYCLPKDTKQLLSNFSQIPNNIIRAIIDSNETRKNYITQNIIKKNPKSVGVYRLTMKSGSDNFRESAVFGIINKLKENNIRTYVYEPELKENLKNIIQVNELEDFIKKSDIIIANRMSKELDHVKRKVYTRDLFREN